MLSEMNHKLSQAARLYDQLLTAQVSSPMRIQPPPVQQYYTPPAQHFIPPQPQQYTAPPTSPPQSHSMEYNVHGPSMAPIYNSSTYASESVPLATTPTPATQPYSYEQPISGPSRYTHPVTIQPQYYQPPVQVAPSPTQATSYPASPPPITEPEVPAVPLPPVQEVLPTPPVHMVASPPPAPPIALVAKQPPPQQPLYFPSVPNDPLPIPLASQHVEQQPQKEAMLISFD